MKKELVGWIVLTLVLCTLVILVSVGFDLARDVKDANGVSLSDIEAYLGEKYDELDIANSGHIMVLARDPRFTRPMEKEDFIASRLEDCVELKNGHYTFNGSQFYWQDDGRLAITGGHEIDDLISDFVVPNLSSANQGNASIGGGVNVKNTAGPFVQDLGNSPYDTVEESQYHGE